MEQNQLLFSFYYTGVQEQENPSLQNASMKWLKKTNSLLVVKHQQVLQLVICQTEGRLSITRTLNLTALLCFYGKSILIN